MDWRQICKGWSSEWEARRRLVRLPSARASADTLKKILSPIQHSLRFFWGCVGLTGTVVLVLIIWHVVEQVQRYTIIVEPFETSKQLETSGYTPRIVANLLVDEIRGVKNKARTIQPAEGDVLLSWSQSDFIVPETGISIKPLIRLIKEKLQLPITHISGDAICHGDHIALNLRIYSFPKEIFEYIHLDETDVSGKRNDTSVLCQGRLIPDSVFEFAAQHIWRNIQPYVLSAYLLFEKKQVQNSKDLLLWVLAVRPRREHSWAYNLLGVIEAKYGESEKQINFQRAQTCFNVALRIAKEFGLQFFPAEVNLANLEMQRENLSGGIKKLDQIRFKYRNLRPAELGAIHYRLGLGYIFSENFEKALEHLNLAVMHDHQSSASLFIQKGPQDYVALARALLEMGNLGQALDALEKASSMKRDMAEIFGLRAQIAMSEGDHHAAIAALNGLTRSDPMNERAYETLFKLGEKGPDILYRWARALANAGNLEAAVEKLKMAIEEKPESVEFHKELGNILVTLQRFDEGLGIFRKALQLESLSGSRRQIEIFIETAKKNQVLAGNSTRVSSEKRRSPSPCDYYVAATTTAPAEMRWDISAAP